MSPNLKRVVVVGGGYGGITVAKALDKNFNVTLIEKRERFFHTAGALRAAVDPGWLSNLIIPYDHLLKQGQIVHSRVVEANPDEVVLEDGRRLPFDYLVLATGSTYPFPAKMASDKVAESVAAVRLVNERVAQAKSILSIGAGPVGIELAAEIASRYPDKVVTLLEAGERLLPASYPQMGERLHQGLQRLGVKVLFGERLVTMPAATNATGPTQPAMQTYLTMKGTPITADVHFLTFGLQLNSEYLRPGLAEALDERKQVKVNRHLQVAGYDHILAVGDLVNTGEAKLITTAEAHARVAAENIRRLAAGNPSLEEYQPRVAAAMSVALGPNGGAVQLPIGKNGLVLGDWAARLITSQSLRGTRQWKELGATPGRDGWHEKPRQAGQQSGPAQGLTRGTNQYGAA